MSSDLSNVSNMFTMPTVIQSCSHTVMQSCVQLNSSHSVGPSAFIAFFHCSGGELQMRKMQCHSGNNLAKAGGLHAVQSLLYGIIYWSATTQEVECQDPCHGGLETDKDSSETAGDS